MTGSSENILDQRQKAPVDIESGKIDAQDLTRSTGRGILWQFAGAGWMTAAQLGSSAVLARVLVPEDFGLLGMALLAKGLIQLVGSFGTTTGVIAKKVVTQEDLSTAFWMEAVVYCLMFVFSFAVASLAATFFHTPELTWVLRIVSITFLMTGASCISGAVLYRELCFGTLKIIEGAGFALQVGLAIVFAVVFDLGYRSLVLSMVLSSLAMTLATIVCARWRPRFYFRRESFRFMLRYGINGLGFSFVLYFQNNIDYLLISRYFGVRILGLYEFAYRIPNMLFNRLAQPISCVVFPALSKVQTSDEKLAAGFIKTAKYISFIVLPMLGGLSVVARPTVLVLWGDQWLRAISPLQLLCISAAIRSVLCCSSTIFLCKNRPDLQFKFGIIQFLVTLVGVAVLGYLYELNGVALGMVVGSFCWIIITHFSLRMVHCSFRRLLGVLCPSMTGTIACVAAAFSVKYIGEIFGLPNWVILLSAIPAGALAYLVILLVFFADQVKEAWQTFRLIISRAPTAAPPGALQKTSSVRSNFVFQNLHHE